MDLKRSLFLNWNKQIELFAKYFCAHARLPQNESFTLLDVGCGTGAALRILKTKYPKAKLSGCDIEVENITISQQLNGHCGHFFVSDIDNLNGHWDFIYLSNLLEHLYEWKEQLNKLLLHTNRIYILVPYLEKIESLPANKLDHSFHINSFDNKSFNFLKSQGYTLQQRVITTPYAWGSSPLRSLLDKYHLGKRKQEFKCELLICITSNKISLPRPFNHLIYSVLCKWYSIIIPIYLDKYLRN